MLDFLDDMLLTERVLAQAVPDQAAQGRLADPMAAWKRLVLLGDDAVNDVQARGEMDLPEFGPGIDRLVEDELLDPHQRVLTYSRPAGRGVHDTHRTTPPKSACSSWLNCETRSSSG